MRRPAPVDALLRRLAGPVMHRLASVAGGVPPGLRRGLGHQTADVPVVVVVVTGADETSLRATVDRVAEVQWATDAFTPVFLLDAPLLSVVRRAGYVVELARPGELGAAVGEALTTYAAAAVVLAPAGGELGALAGVLEAVGDRQAGALESCRRHLRRLEAYLGRLR